MFYAGKSNMGMFSFDSPCWGAYGFKTKKERDEWVADGEYDDVKRVKCPITREQMLRILRPSRSEKIVINADASLDKVWVG